LRDAKSPHRVKEFVMNNDKPFSNKSCCIECFTVGDVIRELERLPKALAVHQGFSESVDIVLFNRKKPSIHVGFADGGEWSNDEES
jgi:hypothetical protein